MDVGVCVRAIRCDERHKSDMFEHRLGSGRGESSRALVPESSDLVQESLNAHCQREMETLT